MPHVVSRNAMTLATPVNELKFYYHVSDLIGNNYSPQAKSLNIKSLNEFNKLNEMTSPIKTTPNRIATQSVPDFLFASSKEANRISPLKFATTGMDLMISIGIILQVLIREMLKKRNTIFILRAREDLRSSTFLMRQHIRPLIFLHQGN